jgi:hypothetical protein
MNMNLVPGQILTNTIAYTPSTHACYGDLVLNPGTVYVTDYIKDIPVGYGAETLIPLSDLFTITTVANCPISACTIYSK